LANIGTWRCRDSHDGWVGACVVAKLVLRCLTSFIIRPNSHNNNQHSLLTRQIPRHQATSPAFSPSSSDSDHIRVNAYWFMSLVFSLSAGLLAALCNRGPGLYASFAAVLQSPVGERKDSPVVSMLACRRLVKFPVNSQQRLRFPSGYSVPARSTRMRSHGQSSFYFPPASAPSPDTS
jgi:hypothetical protein